MAVRFLDNVIDISNYPQLEAQRREAQAKRRVGLGVTGLADALIFAGVRYGTLEAARLAGSWMSIIQNAAYAASVDLAAEKGTFPLYDAKRFLAGYNVAALDTPVREAIRRHGVRNGCLTSIAPTGTISLLAGNVSSGIEPVFDYRYSRRLLARDGTTQEQTVEDYAHAQFRRQFGTAVRLPETFMRAAELNRPSTSPCRRRCSRTSTAPSPRPSIVPRTSPSRLSRTFTSRRTRSGSRVAPPTVRNPVTGAVLAPVAEPEKAAAKAARPALAEVVSASERPGVVYMAPPLERERVLAGYTYKLKWPGSDHAIYVTINDIEQSGRGGPFEIFINTRNLEHYAWTVALTRMISAVFRRGGDVTFVADELKAVFDPQGGHWVAGRYVPSLLAAIGEVIETHMRRTGFLQQSETLPVDQALRQQDAAAQSGSAVSRPARIKLCPRCSSADYVQREGCWVCDACGFSRCG